MAAKMPDVRWYFTKEEIKNTPSIKAGMTFDKELMYRQQCANLIQDIGQKLSVNQLCISTAIVYMHRFYMHHSFTQFNRNSMAACSLFLAAKVEEQFRKVEHVVKVSYACQNKEKSGPLDNNSETFQNMSAELINNESIMLQTLGFDITVDHPHSHVVKCCQLIRAPKDLAQVSYIMATNSLHLTLLSLEYRPSVVACVCIYIACKWSSWEIPRSTEGKDWFWYIDKDVDLPIIQGAMEEFMNIYVKSPHKLKMKLFRKDEPFERRLKSDDSNSTDAISDDLSDFPAAHQKFLNMYHQQHADHAKAAAAAAIAASSNVCAGQKLPPSYLSSTSQAPIRNLATINNNLHPIGSSSHLKQQQSLSGSATTTLPTYPKNSSVGDAHRERLINAKIPLQTKSTVAPNGHLAPPPPQAQQNAKILYHHHHQQTYTTITSATITNTFSASVRDSSMAVDSIMHTHTPTTPVKRARTTCTSFSSSSTIITATSAPSVVVKKAKTMSDLINETRSELKIKQEMLAHQTNPSPITNTILTTSPLPPPIPPLEKVDGGGDIGGGGDKDFLAQTLESIQNQLLGGGNEPVDDTHQHQNRKHKHGHHHHRHHKSSSSSSKGDKKKRKDKKRQRGDSSSGGDRTAARPNPLPLDNTIVVAQPALGNVVEGPQPPPPLPINPPPPLSPLPPLPQN